LVIFAVILIGLAYPRLKRRRARSQASDLPSKKDKIVHQATGEPAPSTNPSAARRAITPAIFFLCAIVVLQAWALWASREFDFRSGLFPWTIGAVLMPLTLFQLGTDLLDLKKRARESGAKDVPGELTQGQVYFRTAKICGWNIGYCVAVWLFGFSLSIALITFLYLKLDARENWGLSVILTSAAWIFFYGLFDYFLHIPFPPGLLFS
jgi:hypothetical protein